jgi:pimeloyl-ACP methyl ester carboxylesterase
MNAKWLTVCLLGVAAGMLGLNSGAGLRAGTSLPPGTEDKTPAYGSNPNRGAYAQINGARIYYERYGRGDPVLLLHGGTSHIAGQGPLIDLLRRHYEVIAVDTRGHGRSTLNDQPMTYPLLADIVWMYEQIPHASLYVAPNGGHGHHTDQIEAFGPILLRFLSGVYAQQGR